MDQATTIATFRIPSQNMPRFQAEMEGINKRAKKLHCTPITWQETDIERHENTDGTVTLFHCIVLQGDTPRIAGYVFMATLEHIDDDTLVRALPGTDEAVLVPYRKAQPACEHCNLNRRRKDTYLLRNEQTGTIKQVGSTCLQEFLGGRDPHAVASMLELLLQADNAGKTCERDMWSDGHGGLIDLSWYLAWVSATMRESGWISKGKARETGDVPTASLAELNADYYTKNKDTSDWRIREKLPTPPDEKDKKRVTEGLAWIQAMDKDELRLQPEGYLFNLYVVCSHVGITARHMGIAASLLVAYDKAMERTREKAERPVSHFQGAIGDKITREMTVTRVSYIDGYMGGSTAVIQLVDAQGNMYTWFNSGSDELEVDHVYTVKGIVKKHEEYKGTEKTVLTRCKAVERIATV